MGITRRTFLASAAAAAAGAAEKRAELGVVLYSYGLRVRGEKGLAEPLAFLALCRERGAAGVQLPLGVPKDATKVRKAAEDAGMFVEGSVRAPADRADVGRFEAEVRAAKACGADVLRTVMLGGRRYEQLEKAEEYARFAKQARASLELAAPVVARLGVKLAVENHKDFRADELLDLLGAVGSENVGVCVDTGNSVALLEEPAGTVAALARRAFTVHLKDMAVEEYADGFLLSEVPLGQGVLDLKALVAALRKANPKVRLNLEMITRDPLTVPCLTEKYWATLEKVPGRDLGRMLALVRRRGKRLPRVSGLSQEKQREVEEANVRASFAYARKELG